MKIFFSKIKALFSKIKLPAKFGRGGNALATIILVIAIIAAVNFIFNQIFWRADITANKKYSLSTASKNTVKNLDDVVNIKAYFSKSVPAKFLNVEREAADFLQEYVNYSNGKIKLEVIDPTPLEEYRDKLAPLGIPPLQFNVFRNDSKQIIQGFIGILVEYGGKQEAIPAVSGVENLEYQLTVTIKRLTLKEMPVIGVVTSHNSIKIKEEASFSYGALGELYSVKEIDLAKEKEIPDNINTLLLVGPKAAFSDEELKKIDSFVMKGKSLAVFADGVTVERGLAKGNKNEINLNKLLEGYGIKINNNLVMDTSMGKASFSAGWAILEVDYPLWPKILPDNFNKENSLASDLTSLTLPWASSLEKSGDKDGRSIIFLAKTTNDSLAQKDNYILNPQNAAALFAAGTAKGPFNMAAFISGKLESPLGQGSTDQARVVVVGDGDFVSDMFTRQGGDNLIFFQNIVDNLTLDSDLSKIRAKSAMESPVKPIDKIKKETLRYLNIFGMTILIVAFGVARYFLRRRKK